MPLIVLFISIPSASGQSIDQLFKEGNSAQDGGNSVRAESIWMQILRKEPDNADAYNNLGIALGEQGKLDEAINAYKRALEIDPDDADAYYNLGIALRRQGKLDEAINAYKRALEIDPDYADAYNNLGIALDEQGKLDEAINAYKRALEIDPDYVLAQNNLAEAERILATRGDPKIVDDSDWLPDDEPLVPLLRSVVRVVANTREGANIGTGWVIKRNDQTLWVLTNRHVISNSDGLKEPSTDIEIEYFSEPPQGQVRLRKIAKLLNNTSADNKNLDLALLEVSNPPSDIQTLNFVTDSISRNTPIKLIGHPAFGIPWSVESGFVSNRTASKLQISQATIAAGNSGGPVLDSEDRVVGIVVETITADETSGTVSSSGLGFAYPMPYLLDMLEDWGVR